MKLSAEIYSTWIVGKVEAPAKANMIDPKAKIKKRFFPITLESLLLIIFKINQIKTRNSFRF